MVETVTRRRKDLDKKAGTADKKDSGRKVEDRKVLRGRYNPKLSDKDSSISHSMLAKLVIGAGAVIYLIYNKMQESEGFVRMAGVEEDIDIKRVQQFLCSPTYKREIQELNPPCVPTKCGRFLVDNLVSTAEAHALLDIAKKGLSKGGGAGGASILDLHSGALSYGENFINLYTSHPNLYTKHDFQVYSTVKDRVKRAVSEHFNIDDDQLYLTHPTFFSELTSLPAKTLHDEYWHDHIDKDTYPSFHYTSLLYLTNYKRDFTGGRFIFIDNHSKTNRTVEPKEGRVSVFTSGPENRHRVEEVSGGTRYALTMGFTCDKTKRIADPGLDQDNKDHDQN
ncbi:2-oxoglutarate and iron-dependent oxygenase domain-containing protein 3-like isoform X1 [Eurytemora carolleeae]|uniref:2-oxoglutarate and iron-dependent oxygenase domain-containing protein 3-like isoform X1 n=1 Tax=Eurytemora carolleeae TaxID=1294199 RepID=UPI000C77FEC1|nr:2-oxoglutarate and iron-dependent oxygenase domain-containing protein 3-like isoform X1 [Eurytemora carolleeae]|eukprot:XP_023341086.1 2-oxoglutarate and iron-dependent oxygenase domain-containing protein 3-like isoform X1 [Eurytemora affinis]